MKACSRVGLVICVPIWLALLDSPAVAHPHRAEVLNGPWLGVVTQNMIFTRLEALDLQYGVEVIRVVPGGPAGGAGIRPKDILVDLDGKPIYSMRRLRWLVRRTQPGDELPLQYVRDKQVQTANVKIDSRRKRPTSTPHHKAFPLSRLDTYLGVGLQYMGDDLRRIFGAPEDSGVLIAEVFADSPAAEAELAAGDVIIKMDRKRIRHISDIYRVLDYFDPEEEIGLEIICDKRMQTINVTLSQRPEGRELGDGWEERDEDLRSLFDPESWREELKGLFGKWSHRHRWRQKSAPSPRPEVL